MRLGGILLTDPPCKCNMRGAHKPFIGLRVLEPQIMHRTRVSERASERAICRVRARESARLNAPSRQVDRSINVKWPSNGLATRRREAARPRICKRGQLCDSDSFYLPVQFAENFIGEFMTFRRTPLIQLNDVTARV